MTIERILLGAHPAVWSWDPYYHVYLVAVHDNGEQEEIDGKPADEGVDFELSSLVYDYTPSQSTGPRDGQGNAVELPLIGNLDAIWQTLQSLGADLDGVYNYDLFSRNSNSFIASLLSQIGISINDFIPGNVSSPHTTWLPGTNTLLGGEGANNLFGFGDGDVIFGGGGDDTLDGGNGGVAGSGNDTLWGDEGEEVASAPGNDVLYGRDGNDELCGGLGDDVLYGGSDNDALVGDNYLGTLSIGGADFLYGEGGDDLLYGGAGDDVLDGGADDDILFGDLDGSSEAIGNDILYGGAGNDELHGGFGRDALLGGDGTDKLYGDDDSGTDLSKSVDLLYGGSGADEFHVGDRDIIIAPDSDDRIYYNGKLLDGGLFAEPEDGWPGGFAGYHIGSEGEIYIAPESTGLFNLLIILPNFDGVVAVIEWYEGSADAGVFIDHENSIVVSDPYQIDAALTAQLIYAELGPLVAAWGWDAEEGEFGPNGPNPAPLPDLWIASDLPFDLTDGVEEEEEGEPELLATGNSPSSSTAIAMPDLFSDDESDIIAPTSSAANGPLFTCSAGSGRSASVADVASISVSTSTPDEATLLAA